MIASIITVGTEILIGSILNTHAQYISEKLNDLGVHVSYHISVRDDFNELKQVINEQINLVDIVLICGGLGPTADDMTKEALSDIIHKKIIIDSDQHKKLIDRFKNLNRPMTENNIKQVMVLEESQILENHWGIAPGEYIEYENTKIFLFPGPPKELRPMIDEYLKDFIIDKNQVLIRSLNVASLGESRVEDKIRKLDLEKDNISINTFARFYDTEIKIIAEGQNKEDLDNEIGQIVEKLYIEFGDYLYSEGNKNLSDTLVEKLKNNNLKISFAESITGGLLSSKITSVPGASEVMEESYITYSNAAKNKVLNVNYDVIEKNGVVSEAVAYEMAKGLKHITNSEICISTTGEAGPNPMEKEVGLCYVCYYFDENNYTIEKYNFKGKRKDIQERLADTVMLNLILKIGR